LAPQWRPLLYFLVGAGFFAPFFLLLWGPTKNSRIVVAIACGLIFASRAADKFWQVLPVYSMDAPAIWLDLAALAALGALMALLFAWALRRSLASHPIWTGDDA
jgi:hypothetical protein